MGTYCTGVEQNHIGIFGGISQLIAQICKNTFVFFSVTDIQLASEALNMGTWCMIKALQ